MLYKNIVIIDLNSLNMLEIRFLQYIDNPLLIDNKKWDMRSYVIFGSFNPIYAVYH